MKDGLFYFSLIDPLLKKLHNRVAEEVPEGAVVIDIACGNGTLPLKYAGKASRVTAIDLSAGKLAFARQMADRRKVGNITFIEMDATDLSRFRDGEFDIATVSMAIHQFRPETGLELLKSLRRISKRVLIADYACPLPGGFPGGITRLIEWMAGKEHNSCFQAYLANGGLPGISELVYPDDPVSIQPAGSVFSVATIG